MKFEGYEQNQKVISGWEVQKRGFVDKVSQAKQAVEAAQRDVNRIVSEAASDNCPGAAKAISEAQAVVLIAQERLKQAQRELDAFPKRPPISSTIYYSLQSEIKQAIRNGTPFQPVLDRMAERQRQQMEDFRLLLILKRDFNNEIETLQDEALRIQREYNGSSTGGSPVYVETSDFRQWIFIREDYLNATWEIEQSVNKPVPAPPSLGNVRIIPEQSFRVGQHETPVNLG